MAAALGLLAVLIFFATGAGEAAADILRRRLVLALPSTVVFAGAATLLRGVTALGAICGWAVALLLWLAAGPGAFLTLLTVFVLTWVATRFGHARKLQRGIAERPAGRSATQVMANLGVGAAAMALGGAGNAAWGGIAALAALAEAAADTVSSEIGQAATTQARLISTFKLVPAGANGGVSAAGTAAGVAAAAAVVAVAVVCGWASSRMALIAAAAGIAGMFADSLLGATLERPGRLNNDSVNALSTLLAAVLAAAAMRI